MKVLFVYGLDESLAIEYLSAALRRAGHRCELLFDPMLFANSTSRTTNRLLARLFSFREQQLDFVRQQAPDLIAFSVVGADYAWARRFAQQIRRVSSAPILFGGRHPTAVPEVVARLPEVDFVCVGEGDEAIVELADALERGADTTGIPNIWTVQGGELYANPPRPLITDVDSLPWPDKDLFYRWVPAWAQGYTAQGRRGCLNACSYCGNNAMRKMYLGDDELEARRYLRLRSVDNLLEELVGQHRRYGFRLIRFVDDDFATDPDWLDEFAEKFPRLLPGVRYKIFINPQSVTPRVVRALERSGCAQVQMGVQSVNLETRRRHLRRSHSQETLVEAIRLLRESSMIVYNDIILGLPWETREQQRGTIDFYLEHPVDYIGAYFLQFFPDTELTRAALRDGHLGPEDERAIIHEPPDRSIIFENQLTPDWAATLQRSIDNMNFLPVPLYRAIRRTGPAAGPIHDVLSGGFSVYRSMHFWVGSFPENWEAFPHPRLTFELPGLQAYSVIKRHSALRVAQALRLRPERVEPCEPARFRRDLQCAGRARASRGANP
jgi:radical SAM superfamily enzyme YgiQ (UPF0313 family)